MNFKEINIGSIIHQKVTELEISMERICNFFNLDELAINEMYNAESIDTLFLLKWSKVLKYDFFRLYSQHLIFYSPPSALESNVKEIKETKLPVFRKNIYTKEIIDYVLELIDSKEKTKAQIIKEYNIPKTTLYKWISKRKM